MSKIRNVFNKNILFLGCHLDDVEFGCGGLIRKCCDAEDVSIRIETLSEHNEDASDNVQLIRDIKEHKKSMSILGCSENEYFIDNLPGQRFDSNQQIIREKLIEIKEEFKPDTIFFPAFNDIHQDHYTLANEAYRIFRDFNCLGYEVIRSSKGFNPNMFLEISNDDINVKIDSIMSYTSQYVQSASYYFNENLIRAIAVFRGGQSNLDLAEGFENYCYRIKMED